MTKRGISLEPSVFEAILGQRLIETAQGFIERHQLTDSALALSQEKQVYQIAHLHEQVPAMPGLYELLDDLERRNLSKAVASSGTRAYVQAVLKEINVSGRFHTLVTAEDVVHGKPAPDVFLRAAQAIDVSPSQCFVLEDAPSGIQAAKAAGMRCVAIPHQYTQGLDLSDADWVLPSLSDVCSLLDELDSSSCIVPQGRAEFRSAGTLRIMRQ